jgi:hypothetical protein
MNDPYTDLKPGDKGEVSFIDDTGTIFVNWDRGSSLGIVYGEDSCKKIETELAKDAQKSRTATYTLPELMDQMVPQALRDQALMCEYIECLGFYAAYQAMDNSFSSVPEKTRGLIENLLPYWGLDDGDGAKPLEDFLDAFDELVYDAKHGFDIGGDHHRICAGIINGSYRYGLEMTVAQGDTAMANILEMSDLIKEAAEYFGFETDKASQLAGRLVDEVWQMLGAYDIPGKAVGGMVNAGYEIQRAVLFDNDRGFVFAHNPNAASPFVTWQLFNDNGKLSYESGHYFSTDEKMLVDYITRSEDYKETYKLTEKPMPEPHAPEPEKKLIRFIDSEYRELFQIPDGVSIRITYPPEDGREPIERACKYHDEYHFSTLGKGGDLYHICQFAEIMEHLGAKYEPSAQIENVALIPFTAGEDKFYLPSREENNTCVGILTGSFGNGGDRYHANWTKKDGGEYTPEIQSELQSAIYALRKDLLKDHDSMLAYCESHPEARLPESDEYKIYGFKLETDARQYFVRCFAEQDSRFSIYAYADKPSLALEHTASAPETSQARDGGKRDAKENGGYSSVLKAIEDAKKTPKPPRKTKETEKKKDRGGDVI